VVNPGSFTVRSGVDRRVSFYGKTLRYSTSIRERCDRIDDCLIEHAVFLLTDKETHRGIDGRIFLRTYYKCSLISVNLTFFLHINTLTYFLTYLHEIYSYFDVGLISYSFLIKSFLCLIYMILIYFMTAII